MSTSSIASHLMGRRKDLAKFVSELDRATGLAFGDDQQRQAAAEAAIKAVAELLESTRDGEGERLGRIFSTLAAQIGPDASADRETRGRNVKGATAYLVEYLASLPGQSRRVRRIARDAAHVLSERAFPFSGKNAGSEGEARGVPRRDNNFLIVSRGETIELWRRRYRTKASDPAADIFRKFRNKRPFKATDNPSANARAAIAWWYEELMRNGY